MLTIQDLHVTVDGKEILKGLSLAVKAGEVHAIMGPNGAGKSTLSNVLAGREGYTVTGGSVTYKGKDLLTMAPEERAREGLFLGFQYPLEINGVGNLYFLRAALNAKRRHRGEEEIDAIDFLAMADAKLKLVEMNKTLAGRFVNQGFSGGEKKRNEIFQMAVLEPTLAVLDEIDSGLDIDALRVISGGINALCAPDRAMILITHYQRLLDYVVPDRVHVLSAGRIVESGGKELAKELEKKGYTGIATEPVGAHP